MRLVLMFAMAAALAFGQADFERNLTVEGGSAGQTVMSSTGTFGPIDFVSSLRAVFMRPNLSR